MPKDFTPDWVKDSVFYQIFPDRFAKSAKQSSLKGFKQWDSKPTPHGYYGGDLWGVIEKLDYLKKLGVTALYFTPVFQSASNHRYHTHDYFQIDPMLGGNPALRALIDGAHKRGMRVVLDGVFNHASRGFFQFNHILESGPDSPYKDWFTVHGYPLNAYDGAPRYEAWIGLAALPKFNYKNPQVRRYILSVAKYWLDFGIDGWRLDVPAEVDETFWPEFRKIVKKTNPQAYITGEIWVDEINRTSGSWLKGDKFDAVMNYGLTGACISFFVGDKVKPQLVAGQPHMAQTTLTAPAFAKRLELLLSRQPLGVSLAQYNLLESHDTARFLTVANGDKRVLKLAYLFLFAFPGAPSVYYGSEAGVEGERDPDCRRTMPWGGKNWDKDLTAWFTKLTDMRKNHIALRRGEYKTVHADKTGLLAFTRTHKQETMLVVINNSETEITPDFTLPNCKPAKLKDLLSGKTITVKDGKLSGLTLHAKTAALFKL